MTQYSPERRTALVFCGSGAHGAYHAGALRALHEAGVKVDVVAAHGGGVIAALFAAVDGGSRLWEADGLWRSGRVATFYGWKWALRAGGYLAALLVGVLLTPLLILAAGLVIYPIGFVLGLFGTDAGATLVGWYSSRLQTAFSGPYLPTIVPRVAMLVLATLALVCLVGARRAGLHTRRQRGSRWWQLVGAPFDTASFHGAVLDALWQLLRGGAVDGRPPSVVFGRRYAEVLQESLGQPGFRELLVMATDLDSRNDIVAALLREPYRRDFLSRIAGRERLAEVLDLAGAGRDHLLDVISGALTPAVAFDPHPITFAGDSFWRGETHRLTDRAGSIARLFEELAEAGVSQVLVVTAVPGELAPHRLSRPRVDLRSRLGELLQTSEAAALRDAVENARLRFDAIFITRPSHNPVGPFDFLGAYDEGSDRHHSLQEVMVLGYEDVYRQFIDPVVGGSGEQLATP